MTTLRQIITDAFRESNVVAVGETPDADQLAEALRRLNAIIKSLYGNEFGEPLLTVNYGSLGLTNVYGQAEDESSVVNSIYVPSNVRLIFNLSAATTLYLNPNPRDGARLAVIDNAGNLATKNATVNANGRLIESATTVVLNTNSLNREWFYRADLGAWTRVTDLVTDDTLPFPEDFDDFFVTLLTMRLNPRYGAETGQEVVSVLQDMKRKFRARYRQVTEMPSEDGIVLLSSNPYARRTLGLSSDIAFNLGLTK